MIAFLKGDKTVVSNFKELGQSEITISPITKMELYYGALNKKELISIKKLYFLFMKYLCQGKFPALQQN